jgi:hypothetical protein
MIPCGEASLTLADDPEAVMPQAARVPYKALVSSNCAETSPKAHADRVELSYWSFKVVRPEMELS